MTKTSLSTHDDPTFSNCNKTSTPTKQVNVKPVPNSSGVVIRANKSTIARPLSSFSSSSSVSTSTISASGKPQSRPNQQLPSAPHTECSSFASSFFSPASSINDSFRKKSGSVSALYLCDTASTKAKKAEIKQNQQQLANNLKDFEHAHPYCSQLGNHQSTAINRRNSMGKKSSVERTGTFNFPIQPASIYSSSIGSNVSSECSLKKQQPSVFDRLSRSAKKV